MKNWSVLFGIAIAIIFGITALFIFSPNDPEFRTLTSEDGFFTVQGDMRQSAQISIDIQDGVASRFILSPVYFIGQADVILDVPVQLSFNTQLVQDVPVEEIVAYRYNEEMMMWESVGPFIEKNDSVAILEVQKLGYYALGKAFDIQLQNEDVAQAIFSLAPKGTAGYEIILGFAPAGEVMIRNLEILEVGGCWGVQYGGDWIERSMQSEVRPVFLDGIVEDVELSWVAFWSVKENSVCAVEDLEAQRAL
ncbi:hypothetical protein KJ766_00025 [Patescibacteria group bacterium]|nr:hypothetical protein [Patescibacteria group bacterium]